YGGHSGAEWNYELGWAPIATLVAAVLNCSTVGIVAWAITTKFQRRLAYKSFERELLREFVRSALVSASRIHDEVLACRKRDTFGDDERQSFVLLFTALGQDLQLIQDTLAMINGRVSV